MNKRIPGPGLSVALRRRHAAEQRLVRAAMAWERRMDNSHLADVLVATQLLLLARRAVSDMKRAIRKHLRSLFQQRKPHGRHSHGQRKEGRP